MDVVTYALLKKKIDGISPSPFHYKGSVQSMDDLPTDAEVGDSYTVLDTNDSYVWDGEQWVKVGTGADPAVASEVQQIINAYPGGGITAGDKFLDLSGARILYNDLRERNEHIQTSLSVDTNWSGSNPYQHSITLSGMIPTTKTRIDILPDANTLNQMNRMSIDMIYIRNNNGTLTAYAYGLRPTETLTLIVDIWEEE